MSEKKTPKAEQTDEAAPEKGGEAETAGAAPEKAAPEPAAEGEVEALAAEAAELKDRLLRTAAELENLRKRAEREKQDAARYAITAFARDLLSVSDNLARALTSLGEDERAGASEAIRNMITGVEMTERELLNVFAKHDIRRIEPKGEKFDPNLHQAMFEVENKDLAAGTVVEVVQSGYVIGDRVLRPAMVGVSRGGAKAQPEPEAEAAKEPSATEAKPGKAETAESSEKAGDKPKGAGMGRKIDTSA